MGTTAIVPSVADHAGVVRLDGVPVRLFLESQDHQHDLVRELKLIQLGERFDAEAAEVSHRLAALISDILTRYERVRSVTREQALAALDRGDDTVALDVPVFPGMAEALHRWLALLDEADVLCSRGELLLPATSEEIRTLRRWYAERLVAELERRPEAGSH